MTLHGDPANPSRTCCNKLRDVAPGPWQQNPSWDLSARCHDHVEEAYEHHEVKHPHSDPVNPLPSFLMVAYA